MIQKLLILTFLFLKLAYCKRICYGELGCFTDEQPFSGTLIRPIAALPESPEKIDTRFFLFNRFTQNEEVNYSNLSANFNSSLQTKFIIHGFMQDANRKWVHKMKDTFLKLEDMNVILVDWSKGNRFPYAQASANAMVTGAEIARLIKYLVENNDTSVEMIHLIGHSLGAHVAGYAGDRIKQFMNKSIDRITGLDPAGPYFEFTPNEVKLDASDADFVDIIHTDGASNLQLGLGLMEASGIIDFYPNGGRDQTGCASLPDKVLTGLVNIVTSNIDDLEDVSGCSHVSAYKFFTDSIENANCYRAYPCSSFSEFKNGNCLNCINARCNQMGYWASKNKGTGSLYLVTQDAHNFPYCTYNYQINLESNDLSSQKQAKGLFTVILKNSLGQFSEKLTIDDSETVFKPNLITNRLLALNQKLNGNITRLIVSYSRTTSIFNRWLYDLEWSFRSIELFDSETQTKAKFCPQNILIQSSNQVEFYLC